MNSTNIRLKNKIIQKIAHKRESIEKTSETRTYTSTIKKFTKILSTVSISRQTIPWYNQTLSNEMFSNATTMIYIQLILVYITTTQNNLLYIRDIRHTRQLIAGGLETWILRSLTLSILFISTAVLMFQFFFLLFLLPFVVNKDVHYRVKFFLKIWVWPTLGAYAYGPILDPTLTGCS